MYEIQQTEKVVICPWCFNPFIDNHDEDDPIKCPVCKREITQEDLQDADDKDN